MTVLWFDGLLHQAEDAGVYFLPEPDIDELLEAAAVNRFPCLRANLLGCRDRAELMLRVAGVLQVPPHVAGDWDELVAALAALAGEGYPGLVLLLEHSEQLRQEAPETFKAAMEALQAASGDWRRRGKPLWAFVALDEDAFDALD